MYKEIGAVDARSRLADLLQEVREGQCYTITLAGEPVADLVPYAEPGAAERAAAVATMRQFEKIKGVSAGDVASWIAEGRHEPGA